MKFGDRTTHKFGDLRLEQGLHGSIRLTFVAKIGPETKMVILRINPPFIFRFLNYPALFIENWNRIRQGLSREKFTVFSGGIPVISRLYVFRRVYQGEFFVGQDPLLGLERLLKLRGCIETLSIPAPKSKKILLGGIDLEFQGSLDTGCGRYCNEINSRGLIYPHNIA